MAEKRFTIQGFRDYRGVQLPDLIRDLEEYRDSVQRAIKEIEALQVEIKNDAEHLDNPEELLGRTDEMIGLFQGYWNDLARIVDEMPLGVQEKHYMTIKVIYDSCRFDWEESYRSFKEEFISRRLKDESKRGILDNVCRAYGDTVYSLLILSDINERLRTYMGDSLQNNKTAKERMKKTGIPELEIPAGTRWEDIRLEFLGHEELKIFINNEPYAVKGYKALGFLDSRTAKKTAVAGKPTRLWTLLAAFAFYNGEISWANITPRKIDASDLRAHLRKLFGIGGAPIDRYDKGKKPAYVTTFRIAPIGPEEFVRISDWVEGTRG